MTPQETIDHFFQQDGLIVGDKKQRSVLLAVIDDLQFNLHNNFRWGVMNLTEEQKRTLQTILPTFSTISLYCSAVDLLARVTQKRLTGRGENSRFFKDCIQTWFHLDAAVADELWSLRNAISHQYSLSSQQVVQQYGTPGVAVRAPNGHWVFNLHAMYLSLWEAKKEIHTHLSAEPDADKLLTQQFLDNNGFFYVPA